MECAGEPQKSWDLHLDSKVLIKRLLLPHSLPGTATLGLQSACNAIYRKVGSYASLLMRNVVK